MSTSEQINQYQTTMRAEFDQLRTLVEAKIAELIKAAGEQMSATFDLEDVITGDTLNTPDWSIFEPPPIPSPTRGNLPADWQGINVPAFKFDPENYLAADLLEKYSYSSDFFDNFLDARLRTYIDSQTYFLATEVQDALFNAMRSRDLQTLNDAVDTVDRVQARKGFPIPTDSILAARNDVIKKYQDTANDRNREITALIADKSLQEKMHAMDKGIEMEKIRSQFQLEFNKVYWQAAEYLVRKFEMEVKAEVAKIDAEIKMLGLIADVDKQNVSDELREEELKNDKNKARLGARIEEMKEQVGLWFKTYEARIKAAEESVNYYKAAAMGITGTYNAIDYSGTSTTTTTA